MSNCHLPPHQPKFEAVLSEIDAAINELHYAISNLSSWMKPEYVSKNLVGQYNIQGYTSDYSSDICRYS